MTGRTATKRETEERSQNVGDASIKGRLWPPFVHQNVTRPKSRNRGWG